jgi:4'-phosphopantetheinyl transferase
VGSDVGCDAEALSRPALTPETLELCFTARERETLESCAPPERHARSLRLFTLKEAYAKARGLGLALDLQSFEVGLSPPALLRPSPDDPGAWTLAQPACGPHHVLGLAVPDASLECGAILWPFEG